MSSRIEYKPKQDIPGPGVYTLKSKAIEGRQSSLYGKLGSVFDVKNKNPGPGRYNPKILDRNTQASKIGKSNHLNCEDMRTTFELGPGSYNITKRL